MTPRSLIQAIEAVCVAEALLTDMGDGAAYHLDRHCLGSARFSSFLLHSTPLIVSPQYPHLLSEGKENLIQKVFSKWSRVSKKDIGPNINPDTTKFA